MVDATALHIFAFELQRSLIFRHLRVVRLSRLASTPGLVYLRSFVERELVREGFAVSDSVPDLQQQFFNQAIFLQVELEAVSLLHSARTARSVFLTGFLRSDLLGQDSLVRLCAKQSVHVVGRAVTDDFVVDDDAVLDHGVLARDLVRLTAFAFAAYRLSVLVGLGGDVAELHVLLWLVLLRLHA